MTENVNPYSAPTTDLNPHPSQARDADGDEVSIREEHFLYERSIRAIGFLFYLSSGIIMLGVVASLADRESGVTVVFAIFGLACVAIGRGLRQLKQWARLPAGFLCLPGLFAFPIGTLICGSLMWMLFQRKHRIVFTHEYQDVIEKTGGIAFFRSQVFDYIVLVLLSLLLLMGALGAIMMLTVR